MLDDGVACVHFRDELGKRPDIQRLIFRLNTFANLIIVNPIFGRMPLSYV